MKILAFIIGCILWASMGWASVTIDDSSHGTCKFYTTANSWTSHTIAGTDRLLLVGVHIESNTVTVANITYGAAGLTKIDSITGTLEHTEVWKLIAPTTGTATIEVTLTGTPDYGACAIAISLTDVDQTSPVGTAVKEAGGDVSTNSIDVTGITDGLVIDFIGETAGTTPTKGTSQTLIQGLYETGSSYRSGTGPLAMEWSWVNNATFSQIGLPVNPVSTGSAIKRRTIICE